MDNSWAKVGVQCVCVDDVPKHGHPDDIWPKKNKIYTIRELSLSEYHNILACRLVEIINPKRDYRGNIHCEASFNLNRFRPLSETRNEMFKKIIADTPQDLIEETKKELELV